MVIPKINSAHGSDTRNIINEIIKAINDRGLEILSESAFLNWLDENGVKHQGEWDDTKEYVRLSVVLHEGNSYTSIKHVPVGIDILNEEFWVVTGNYNAQVEYYRQEVSELGDDILEIDTRVSGKLDSTVEYVDNEIIDFKNDINGNINNFKDNVNTYIGINIDDFPRLTSESDDVGRFKRVFQDLTLNDRNIVYLNDDEYILGSEELEIPKDNIHFIGKGNGSVIKIKDNVSLTNGAIIGYGKHGTKFTNITFDGNISNQTRTHHIVRLENCDFTTFEGCQFKNIYGTAIVLSGSRYCYLNNILFNNIDGEGGNPGECIYAQGIKFSSFNDINAYDIGDHLIYIDSSDVHGISEHCHFNTVVGQNCGMNNITTGAAFNICNDSHNFNFMNCHSIESRSGFYFHENGVTGKVPTQYNLINCSALHSYFGSGFYFKGLDGKRSVIFSMVTNCSAIKNTGGGSASGFRIENIEGLTMMNIDGIENGHHGVTVTNSKRVKQIGGYVYDNGVTVSVQGIRVHTSDMIELTDVTSKNLNTSNQSAGLSVLSGSTNVIVKSGEYDSVLMDKGTGYYYPDNNTIHLIYNVEKSEDKMSIYKGSEYVDSLISDDNGLTVVLKNLPNVTIPTTIPNTRGNGFGTANTQMEYVYNRGGSNEAVFIGLKATATSSHTPLDLITVGTVELIILI